MMAELPANSQTDHALVEAYTSGDFSYDFSGCRIKIDNYFDWVGNAEQSKADLLEVAAKAILNYLAETHNQPEMLRPDAITIAYTQNLVEKLDMTPEEEE